MAPKLSRKVRPRRGNLAIQAADRLRTAILRGKYCDEHPLREVELCRELGISRIPLREALHRLEGEGLVEIRPNRGAAVASLSQAELAEIAELCRMIEGHLLRHSIPALKREFLDRAATLLELMDEVDDAAEWGRINWKFHETLYSAARRPLALKLIASLRGRADRAMHMLIADKERRLRLNREHRAILAAVRARRGARAALLLDAHLQGGKEEVLRLMSSKS